jgi:hypothetical protein
MSTVATLPADCANCGAPLGGPYCQTCGQKAAGPNVSLHDFFHEAFHEFAHVDGKIVQTLRLLLTRPGELTCDFLAGRRQRYVSPLRLYLTCSLIFFALAAEAPRSGKAFLTVTKVDGEEHLDPARVQELRAEATARANELLLHNLPRVMFVLMPAFGLLTWLFYRKAQPFYAAHLYYSVHFHAFVFLVLTTAIGLRPVVGTIVANTVPMAAIGFFHFKGLRRVFGGSVPAMLWKGILIWAVYVVMIGGSILAVGLWSVRASKPEAERLHADTVTAIGSVAAPNHLTCSDTRSTRIVSTPAFGNTS